MNDQYIHIIDSIRVEDYWKPGTNCKETVGCMEPAFVGEIALEWKHVPSFIHSSVGRDRSWFWGMLNGLV